MNLKQEKQIENQKNEFKYRKTNLHTEKKSCIMPQKYSFVFTKTIFNAKL